MNKKMFIIALLVGVICLLIAGPTMSYAQSAKDAIMALKKLEARTEVGISYQDYISALGETKFPVNIYLESKESVNNSQLKYAIVKAMRCYDDAKTYWKYVFDADGIIGMWPDTLKKYPEAKEPIKAGGASVNKWPFGRRLMVKALLPIVWKHASQELTKATELMSKSEIKPTDETAILKKELADLKAKMEKLNKK